MLIWHPDVHRAYGEQLYFFLIQSRFYSSDFRDSVRHELETLAPGAWLLAETLGYYDLLARVWLTSNSYQGFARWLDESPQTRRFEVFDCAWHNSIRYLWSDEFRQRPSLDPGEILAFEREVLEGAQNRDPGAQAKLQKMGLILADHVDRTHYGRFYCLVKFLGQSDFELTSSAESDLMTLAEDKSVDGLSVYSGRGFADVLIKGRVDSPEGMHEFPLGLRALPAFGPRIRTQTIVVGKPTCAQQCDYINFAAATASSEQQLRFGQYVGKQLPSSGEPSAGEVLQAFQATASLFPHDQDGYLRRVFRGWLSHSVVEVKSGVLPVLEIEGVLEEYFRRRMQECYGRDWVKDGLQTVATRGGLKDPAKRLDRFTFDDYICCLAALDKEQALGVEEDLGTQWERELRAIEPVRNKCAHALRAESSSARNIIEHLRVSLPMYYKLRAAVERLRSEQ